MSPSWKDLDYEAANLGRKTPTYPRTLPANSSLDETLKALAPFKNVASGFLMAPVDFALIQKLSDERMADEGQVEGTRPEINGIRVRVSRYMPDGLVAVEGRRGEILQVIKLYERPETPEGAA